MRINFFFPSSDPYLLHLSGNTYILKALLIHYLLLTISYDKLTLNMGNVRKCLYLYPVFENKLKKKKKNCSHFNIYEQDKFHTQLS